VWLFADPDAVPPKDRAGRLCKHCLDAQPMRKHVVELFHGRAMCLPDYPEQCVGMAIPYTKEGS
jgi:hypothetical protein